MILVIVWFALAVLFVWPCRCVVLDSVTFQGEKVDKTDQWMSGAVGFAMALMWPAILAGFLAFTISRRIWTGKWYPIKVRHRDPA